MEILDRDKEHLVSELEKLTGTRPLFYLKFCSKEKFATDICEGRLYANTPEYFRKKEIESGERGQGDQFELISIIEAQSISMCDKETNEIVMTAPKGTLRFQFRDDDLVPMVSFVGMTLRDMKLVYADEKHADFLFPFTEEENNNLVERFGKFCVIVDGKELERHINCYCQAKECDYIFDKVEYCEQNRLDRMKAFSNSAKERFLYKNKDLAYQREYRLVIAHEMPIDHFIRIGKLDNVKILSAEDIKGFKLTIGYISHQIDEEMI